MSYKYRCSQIYIQARPLPLNFRLLYLPAAAAAAVTSVISDSMRPHKWQPTRLPSPWDSPVNNTGVGCHFLLQCMKVKSESEITQSCPTVSDPMDCSPPGSSIHGIFQARVLEWVAIAFSVWNHTFKLKMPLLILAFKWCCVLENFISCQANLKLSNLNEVNRAEQNCCEHWLRHRLQASTWAQQVFICTRC